LNFDGLLGQQEIKQKLTGIVSTGKINHAYLFSGADGIGKMTFGKEFAAMCMCTQSSNGRRCGKCKSCVLFESGNNLDLKIIEPEEGKSIISVDAIRDELQEDILKAPNFSAKRVYIIDQAEKLNEQAQNALLKTFEEPPSYVTILLLCSNVQSMLDTIKSRSVIFEFRRNSNEDIVKKAEQIRNENPDVSMLSADFIVSYADGVIGRVEEIMRESENISQREQIAEIFEPLLSGNTDAKMKMTEIINVKNKKFDFPFFVIMSFLRDSMLLARYGNKAKIMNPDFREILVNSGLSAGYYKLKNALFVVDESYKLLRRNAMADLTIENMLISISKS